MHEQEPHCTVTSPAIFPLRRLVALSDIRKRNYDAGTMWGSAYVLLIPSKFNHKKNWKLKKIENWKKLKIEKNWKLKKIENWKKLKIKKNWNLEMLNLEMLKSWKSWKLKKGSQNNGFLKMFKCWFPKIMVEQCRCLLVDELSMTEIRSLNYIAIYTFSSKFTEGLVLKIMDFLKCSRASQWHGVPGCKFCKRVSPKRNAQKNILKNSLFKVHHCLTKC